MSTTVRGSRNSGYGAGLQLRHVRIQIVGGKSEREEAGSMLFQMPDQFLPCRRPVLHGNQLQIRVFQHDQPVGGSPSRMGTSFI